MVALVDVEVALTLFAEGIAGRYYHIKPTSEFHSRHIDLPADQTAMASDTAMVSTVAMPPRNPPATQDVTIPAR